jgi:Tfp pilus assembly protein PilO
MSQPLSASQRSLRAEQIRRQIAQFRGSRSQGMFGVAELLGVSISILMLVAVLVGYFYFLVPAQSRRDLQQRERARLQTLLRTSAAAIQNESDTKEIVEKITGSIEEFETQRLAQQAKGRMDLYEELNELMKKNGLSNTSGPTYTNLDIVTSKTANRSTSAKWQSVYPGIAVAVTVEGQYQNLRRFVRDLETSEQFIIINGVELERATETNAPLSADAATSGSRGSLVSLRLDLATYFQRNHADNPLAVSGGQK